MIDKEKVNEVKSSLKEKIGKGYMAFARRSYESGNICLDLMDFWKKSCGWYKAAIIFRLILSIVCIYGSVVLSTSVGWFFLYLLGFACLAGALIYGIDTLILNWTYGSRREFYLKFVQKTSEDGDHVKSCETPEHLRDYKYRDTIVEENHANEKKKKEEPVDADATTATTEEEEEEEKHTVEIEA